MVLDAELDLKMLLMQQDAPVLLMLGSCHVTNIDDSGAEMNLDTRLVQQDPPVLPLLGSWHVFRIKWGSFSLTGDDARGTEEPAWRCR